MSMGVMSPSPPPPNFLRQSKKDNSYPKKRMQRETTGPVHDLSPLPATSVDPARGRIEGPRSSWNFEISFFLNLFAGRKVVDKAFFFLRLIYSFENMNSIFCSYIINDWIYPTWPQITLQTLGQLHFEKKKIKITLFLNGQYFFYLKISWASLLPCSWNLQYTVWSE